jgi:hypothetical protein
LTMTGEKRMGDYNKTNFVWSLKNVTDEQNWTDTNRKWSNSNPN